MAAAGALDHRQTNDALERNSAAMNRFRSSPVTKRYRLESGIFGECFGDIKGNKPTSVAVKKVKALPDDCNLIILYFY